MTAIQRLNTGRSAQFSDSGGGGATMADIFYKDFFSNASMLPSTVYKEELYTFPARDWAVNAGPGGDPTHALLQSRDRITGTANADYRFGWDTGALHDKMLIVVGGLRNRAYATGIFVTDVTALTNSALEVDQGIASPSYFFTATGVGTETLNDYTELSDTRNREISRAIYYSRLDNIIRLFWKEAGGQWFPISSLTGNFGQVRYAGIRVTPSVSGDQFNAVCPLVVRYE